MSGEVWACPQCTFLNSGSVQCEMCESPAPPRVRQSLPGGTTTDAPVYSWKCETCRYQNTDYSAPCFLCHRPPPPDPFSFWPCLHCSYNNPPSASQCESCAKGRQAEQPPVAPTPSATPVVPSSTSTPTQTTSVPATRSSPVSPPTSQQHSTPSRPPELQSTTGEAAPVSSPQSSPASPATQTTPLFSSSLRVSAVEVTPPLASSASASPATEPAHGTPTPIATESSPLLSPSATSSSAPPPPPSSSPPSSSSAASSSVSTADSLLLVPVPASSKAEAIEKVFHSDQWESDDAFLQAMKPLQSAGVKSLALINNRLDHLPLPFLTDFSGLRSLIIIHNLLSSLPAEINSLSDLHLLDCSHNQLVNLDLDFNRLVSLSTLRCTHNRIGCLSVQGEPGSLQHLSLSRNFLIDDSPFKQALVSLTNLRHLDLSGNRLVQLSPDIFQSLRSLTTLQLESNCFDHVPFAISSLIKLERLNISNNRISYLPGFLARLPELSLVTADDNQIQWLPLEFRTKQLVLELHGNPVLTEPAKAWRTSLPDELEQVPSVLHECVNNSPEGYWSCIFCSSPLVHPPSWILAGPIQRANMPSISGMTGKSLSALGVFCSNSCYSDRPEFV